MEIRKHKTIIEDQSASAGSGIRTLQHKAPRLVGKPEKYGNKPEECGFPIQCFYGLQQ